MIDTATVWSRIVAHKGEVYHLVGGNEFTYEVIGNAIKPNRVNRLIPKSDIEAALHHVPFGTTTEATRLGVQAPSYLFAILMDPRVRLGDW